MALRAPSGLLHGEATEQRVVRLEVGGPDQPCLVAPPDRVVAASGSDVGLAVLHRRRPRRIVEFGPAPAVRLRRRRETAGRRPCLVFLYRRSFQSRTRTATQILAYAAASMSGQALPAAGRLRRDCLNQDLQDYKIFRMHPISCSSFNPVNPDRSYAVGPLDSRFRGNDGYAAGMTGMRLRASMLDCVSPILIQTIVIGRTGAICNRKITIPLHLC